MLGRCCSGGRVVMNVSEVEGERVGGGEGDAEMVDGIV